MITQRRGECQFRRVSRMFLYIPFRYFLFFADPYRSLQIIPDLYCFSVIEVMKPFSSISKDPQTVTSPSRALYP